MQNNEIQSSAQDMHPSYFSSFPPFKRMSAKKLLQGERGSNHPGKLLTKNLRVLNLRREDKAVFEFKPFPETSREETMKYNLLARYASFLFLFIPAIQKNECKETFCADKEDPTTLGKLLTKNPGVLNLRRKDRVVIEFKPFLRLTREE
ncbi:hypothetical protein CEXT_738621 [Caerostris extrusa]|uniref:Uncharacterized protein n=1 Tax=Caerostris extrusa TaxID=172846 RepID=A0AAV4VXZ1_CAEEX|nr:hypothetical protein CEXT_738621 [Caerostris extrusa]